MIRPGMEPPNFNGIEYHKTEKIKFSYFGGLSRERSLLSIIKGINQLLVDKPEYSKIVELNVFGGELDELSKEFVRINPCSFLKLHGRLEYDKDSKKSGRQQVLEKMRTSDVLVLIHGIGQITKLYIPSKTYEYLWTKRPIMLLTPCPEEWTELLPEKEHFIIESGVQEQLFAGLHSFVDMWQNGGLPDRKLSVPFSAEEATLKIIKLAVKENSQ